MKEIEKVLSEYPGRKVEFRKDSHTSDFYAYVIDDTKVIVCSGAGASMGACISNLAANIKRYFENK